MEFVSEGLTLRFGDEVGDWVDIYPNVKVEQLSSDADRLVTVTGVFRLRGNSIPALTVEKLA